MLRTFLKRLKNDKKYLVSSIFLLTILVITLTSLFSFCTTPHFKKKAEFVENYCKEKNFDVLYLNNVAYACITQGSGLIRYEQIRGYHE